MSLCQPQQFDLLIHLVLRMLALLLRDTGIMTLYVGVVCHLLLKALKISLKDSLYVAFVILDQWNMYYISSYANLMLTFQIN